MIGTIYTNIKCDGCGEQWFGCSDTKVNVRLARRQLKRDGFVRVVRGGKRRDYCPACAAQLKDKLR